MKKLLLAYLLLPLISMSQKIKESEIDKFTKEKRIRTSLEYIKTGLTQTVGLWYRSADSTCFINLNAVGWAVAVVGTGDRLIFLLHNDETVTASSTGVQSYNTVRFGGAYDHQYLIAKQDVEKLAAHNLKSIRRYTSDTYADLDLGDKKQDQLKKLSEVFLAELNKSSTL